MKRFSLILITLVSATQLTQARQYEVNGPLGGLSMTLTLPEDFNEEQDKCPMVILMHGIFSSKNIVPIPAIARELAEEGIASIRFDFGGHWNSEGRMQDMTIGNEISDALSMWEYAKSLPYVSQIGLLGHSQGGVVASMTAGILSERGESPAALVLIAPGSVVQDACRNGRFFGAEFSPSDPPEFVRCFGVMKLGREYILSTQELDIYGTAKSYTGPVRIIHGSKDNIVPMSCSEKYVEAYQQPTELIVVEGENHMITRKLKTVVSHAVSFFKQEFSKSAMVQNSSDMISRLEVYDMETRTHSVLKTFPYIIEAPNWTPDGRFLVVNKDGRLFKIAADGSSDLTEIESGDITHCNSDLVITAEGGMDADGSNRKQMTFDEDMHFPY